MDASEEQGPTVDLTSCDREPIHVLGAVQPFGFLLAVSPDWIVVRARRLPERAWLSWLTIPLVYGVYTLIRGPIADWYPYPFIDPRGQGYLSMTISLVVVFVGMAFMSFGVYWVGTRGRRPDAPEPGQPADERG